MVPAVKNLVRLTAAGYSKNLLARRELYEFMVKNEKGVCERLKRLQPAENKLFGGKVPGLTKALRHGDQVIIQLLFSQVVDKLVVFFPLLGIFGKKDIPFEVKKKTFGNSMAYQPGAFNGTGKPSWQVGLQGPWARFY